MKGQTVVLSGESKEFKEGFRKVVEECGLKVVFPEDGAGACAGGLFIYEAASRAGLKAVGTLEDSKPFVLFTALQLDAAELEALKLRGLSGVLTGRSAPEDVYFTICNALFHDRMLRRNLRAPANLQVELSTGQGAMSAASSLLSRDGMFIVTIHPLPVGSVCEIAFRLPGAEKTMRTKARVLYNISINKELSIIANPDEPFKRIVTHPGMAVFFIDLPEADRNAVDEFVLSAVERGA